MFGINKSEALQSIYTSVIFDVELLYLYVPKGCRIFVFLCSCFTVVSY